MEIVIFFTALLLIVTIVLHFRNNATAKFTHEQIELFFETRYFLSKTDDERCRKLFFDENGKEILFDSTIEDYNTILFKFWIWNLKKFRKNKEFYNELEKIYNEEVLKICNDYFVGKVLE